MPDETDNVQKITDASPKNNGDGPVAAEVTELTEALLLKELRIVRSNQSAILYLGGAIVGLLILVYIQGKVRS